jgi:hypothetical protein
MDMELLKHCRVLIWKRKEQDRRRSTRLALQGFHEDVWSKNDVCMAENLQRVAKQCNKHKLRHPQIDLYI